MPTTPEQLKRRQKRRRRAIAKRALTYVKNETKLDHTDPLVQQTLLALAAGGWLKTPVGRTPAVAVREAIRGDRIDRTGTVRRLRALAFEGWSPTALSRELGWPVSTFRGLLDENYVHRPVDEDVAAAVAELYDQAGELAPDVELRNASRTRNGAARRGWIPRAGWDGLDMDDPDVRTTFAFETVQVGS